MEIILYDFSKRENSTKRPNQGGVKINVSLKEQTSIDTPSFILTSQDMQKFNYVQYGRFYYYIEDTISLAKDTWQIDCVIDVLATWKAEIGNTRAFKLYSTLGYNTAIPDTRLSTKDIRTVQKTSVKMYDKSQRYLINYVTSEPTRGGSGIVCVDSGTALDIAKEITNDNLIQALVELQKSLQSAYDSVISCISIPFDVSSGVSWPIYLGNYMTGISGDIPELYLEKVVFIDIPWQFNDFRNMAPYTSLILYLPHYGPIELNPSDFIGKSRITVTMGISGLDGTGSYLIDGIIKVPVNFGTFMPMNGVAYNPLSILSGGASFLTSLATGNLLGAGHTAFNSTLATNTRYTGSGGGYGGTSTYINPEGFEYNYCVLFSICHDTTVQPSTVGTIQGRPVNAIADVTNGYNQFANASIDCDAPQRLKTEINNYMNGGFYYE